MRLISATINGYGRIATGKINLDSKVIAIVGPNEAGKTSLLRALRYLDETEELASKYRSRSVKFTDETKVVTVDFLLDIEDEEAVSHLNLESPPKRMVLSRRADGHIENMIIPTPKKSRKKLDDSWEIISRYFNSQSGKKLLDSIRQSNLAESKPKSVPLDLLPNFLEEIHRNNEVVESLEINRVNLFIELCTELENEKALPLRVLRALQELLLWHKTKSPISDARKILWSRSPNFVFFDDESRTISSNYALDDSLMQEVPPPLQNLANLAGLDIESLWENITAGRTGLIQTQLRLANNELKRRYTDSWYQSNLTVEFDVQNHVLHILIVDDNEQVTVFDERSAGLRMFVALSAFLATREINAPPILLIDEAETHLHYDAQADLVNTFMKQKQAAKIIYTTHSPACLPPDLGSSVRAVLPKRDQPSISEIHNSFWHGAAGFSPLMLAMGAGAAAFTPARFVVLAEGASEMILLPSLIRNAIGANDLEYQVAPGLSETPHSMYKELDLEGARVAYVVDGDEGGMRLRANLISGGVDKNRIAVIGATTLENVIEPALYRERMRHLLSICNTGFSVPELPPLPRIDGLAWPNVIQKWAEGLGMKFPSKVAFANLLVESDSAKVSHEGREALATLDSEVRNILGIKTEMNSR